MNVTEITKIQVAPEQEDLKPQVARAADRQGLLFTTVSVQLRVKLALGRILHPLGVHTWARWMQYDDTSDRVIDTGGFICEFCPLARLS